MNVFSDFEVGVMRKDVRSWKIIKYWQHRRPCHAEQGALKCSPKVKKTSETWDTYQKHIRKVLEGYQGNVLETYWKHIAKFRVEVPDEDDLGRRAAACITGWSPRGLVGAATPPPLQNRFQCRRTTATSNDGDAPISLPIFISLFVVSIVLWAVRRVSSMFRFPSSDPNSFLLKRVLKARCV